MHPTTEEDDFSLLPASCAAPLLALRNEIHRALNALRLATTPNAINSAIADLASVRDATTSLFAAGAMKFVPLREFDIPFNIESVGDLPDVTATLHNCPSGHARRLSRSGSRRRVKILKRSYSTSTRQAHHFVTDTNTATRRQSMTLLFCAVHFCRLRRLILRIPALATRDDPTAACDGQLDGELQAQYAKILADELAFRHVYKREVAAMLLTQILTARLRSAW